MYDSWTVSVGPKVLLDQVDSVKRIQEYCDKIQISNIVLYIVVLKSNYK